MKLTTPQGRTLNVEAEADYRLGRVYYRVERVGTFTVETDPDYGGRHHGEYLHVMYGRAEAEWHSSYEPTPDEPVVYGVSICGGWVLDPQKLLADLAEQGERYWRGHASRRTGLDTTTSAPDATRRRVGDIVGALTADFLARPDKVALDHAGEVLRAPGRLVEEQRQIASLREEIAERRGKLAAALARADAYLALIPDAAGTVAATG